MSEIPLLRRGTSVHEFFERFPDEASCLAHVFEVRRRAHLPCRCGRTGLWRLAPGERSARHGCHREAAVLQDTALFRTHLPLTAWFYAMLLFANANGGMRTLFVERLLGLDHGTAHRLCRQIRLHMAAYARPARLGGPGQTVHVDETLLRRIMHEGRTDTLQRVIVMGMACGHTVLTGIIPDRSARTMRACIERHIAPGSRIVTDGHKGYLWLKQAGWEHTVVDHSVAMTDFKGNDLNRIETYWRVLKRTLTIYRKVERRYLWLYLAETEFGYNNRGSSESNFETMIKHFPAVNGPQLDSLRQRFDWTGIADLGAIEV